MTSARRHQIWPTLIAVLAFPAAAQQTDDQTRDYEDQDRRYYERMLKEQEEQVEQADEPESGEDVAEEDAAAFLAKAVELIKDPNYVSRTTDHYYVQTDDSSLDSKAAASLLESFRGFFDGLWSDRLELKPYEEESRVFLFRSFYKYNEMLGFDARRMPLRPAGHYLSVFNVMVVHTRAGSPAALADSLVHEAAHQLVDQRIYGGSGIALPWTSEGLGAYFGYTFRDKNGAFRAGDIGGKSVSLIRDAPAAGNEGAAALKRLRSSLKEVAREPGFLDRLVSTVDPQAFYGGDVQANYSISWILVHYLLHGDGGAHAGAFVRYLQAEAEGRGGGEALYGELGTTAEELEAALLTYAKQVKTR